jgi:hypothetical protein
MKLRIQGNSLRLRLTRSEVAQLCESAALEGSVDFGSGTVLIYRVESRGGPDPLHAVFCSGAITVRVPAGSIAAWASADEVGLYAQQGVLKIAVEKDFRCLTRRPDEQEPDAYPHPAEIVSTERGGQSCLS